jgi:hypothetical protein
VTLFNQLNGVRLLIEFLAKSKYVNEVSHDTKEISVKFRETNCKYVKLPREETNERSSGTTYQSDNVVSLFKSFILAAFHNIV